ncbi:MAG: DUF4124 domain-containing protein [Gammaproteobacteria bacterium]|nr:DUF4124 domain-containing protein [Gammaproteobacteria bacterium]
MKNGYLLGLVVCFFLTLPVQAEVYKWTDEHGRVHFSDKPPSKDTPAYQLRTPASAASTSSQESLTDAERRARQKKLSDSLEADRQEKQKAESTREQQQARREHNCKVARAEWTASKRANLIYDYDQQGNRVYYSEAKKQRYLESLHAEVRKWCD